MIGHPRAHHAVTDSTNRIARELAAGGAPHGTVVTAGEQTAGRGRSHRVWIAPAGSSVLLSLIVRGTDTRHTSLLPLTTAVALADVLEQWLDGVAIKWPNDVWVGAKKIAGILVEGRPQEGWAVIGMGVNVTTDRESFPVELQDAATSVAAAGATGHGVEEVMAVLLAALDSRLAQDPDTVLAAWRARDALLGTTVTWEGGSGTAAGVDDDGALLVDTAEGHVRLDAGEVHLAAT